MKKRPEKRSKPTAGADPSPYPRGWNRKRVQALIEYYENQSDEAAIAEAQGAYAKKGTAMIQVPIKLMPQVQRLLTRRAG